MGEVKLTENNVSDKVNSGRLKEQIQSSFEDLKTLKDETIKLKQSIIENINIDDAKKILQDAKYRFDKNNNFKEVFSDTSTEELKGAGFTLALQIALKKLGYYGNGMIDGMYGPQTKAAVIAFQKKNGLTSDGAAGRDTLTKLLENLGVSVIPGDSETNKLGKIVKTEDDTNNTNTSRRLSARKVESSDINNSKGILINEIVVTAKLSELASIKKIRSEYIESRDNTRKTEIFIQVKKYFKENVLKNFSDESFHIAFTQAFLEEKNNFMWNYKQYYIVDSGNNIKVATNENEYKSAESEMEGKQYAESVFPGYLTIEQAGQEWYIKGSKSPFISNLPFRNKESAQVFIDQNKKIITGIYKKMNIYTREYFLRKQKYINIIVKLLVTQSSEKEANQKKMLGFMIDQLDCWDRKKPETLTESISRNDKELLEWLDNPKLSLK